MTALNRFCLDHPRSGLQIDPLVGEDGKGCGFSAILTHEPEDPSCGVALRIEAQAPTIEEALRRLEAGLPASHTARLQSVAILRPAAEYFPHMGPVLWWPEGESAFVGDFRVGVPWWSELPRPIFPSEVSQ